MGYYNEESGSFTTSHFNGDSIHQKNIDEKSEHEILTTLQQMTMAVSTCKDKRLTGSQATTTLVVGFTGTN